MNTRRRNTSLLLLQPLGDEGMEGGLEIPCPSPASGCEELLCRNWPGPETAVVACRFLIPASVLIAPHGASASSWSGAEGVLGLSLCLDQLGMVVAMAAEGVGVCVSALPCSLLLPTSPHPWIYLCLLITILGLSFSSAEWCEASQVFYLALFAEFMLRSHTSNPPGIPKL